MDRRGDAMLAGALAGVIALVVSLLIGLGFAPFREAVGLENVTILYVALVAVAAVAGGRIGGLIAALVAALSYNFFFTTPYGSLRVDSAEQVITVVLLFAVGAVATLAGDLERRATRRRLTRARRRDAQAVGVVAEVLDARRQGGDPRPLAVDAIRRLLHARAVAAVDPDDLAAGPSAVSGDGLPADLAALPRLDERGLEALAEAAPLGVDPVLPAGGVVLTVTTGPASRAGFAILPQAGHRLSQPERTALLIVATELQRPAVQA